MSVLLIDTFSLFFRSFHALPPMTTLAGEPTGALYGFSALLLKLLREQKPKGVAFAVDRPEPTFRHESYGEYKAGRAPLPSPLVQQLRKLDTLLEAFGFPRFSARGFEADDVLATLAAQIAEPVRIATGDRDMLQLVDERVQVVFLGQRGKPPKLYDEAAVQERFGIPPSRLPLYSALVGDSSDNIPKVKGIGPAAAQKLASEFPTIDALLAGEIANTRLRTLIHDHADQLRASELLITLRRDVPLTGELYAPLTTESAQRTHALFEALEFKSLIPRLEALVGRD
ncbi:MAG TPA: 5'-3' exonuclease H3TH domain-containing protein [Polyangiales bacterium]|nr:5'-3' exonuclease H3TH domain-containing protein [Polyangiales bacterium]